MATFAMLTRLTPETLKSPADLKRLEKEVSERIRKECPLVKWLANYAILGPYDYRSIGHAQTETWTALPWERFEHLLGAGAGMPSRARAVSARGESRVHRAV
ncbi:MAG: GYD family protein [Deltaproteobacteria bacterium]|nr:GYD family protein [Deltaproteobacteria bacterium]